MREAYKEHLLGPIVAVKDELFKTFRQEPDQLCSTALLYIDANILSHTVPTESATQ